MLGIELPCESLLVGGLPLSCSPPPFGTGVAVGVRLVPVCVGPAEGVGNGVEAVVGAGVGLTGVGVRDGVGVGVGVGVAMQLQETLTEFTGPVKVIVSCSRQEMVEGIVMVTETCPLG